jgi:hypothetical protein
VRITGFVVMASVADGGGIIKRKELWGKRTERQVLPTSEWLMVWYGSAWPMHPLGIGLGDSDRIGLGIGLLWLWLWLCFSERLLAALLESFSGLYCKHRRNRDDRYGWHGMAWHGHDLVSVAHLHCAAPVAEVGM